MGIFSLALRNARQRSGLSIIATIALTAMLISGSLNIGACLQQSYLNTFIQEYGDSHAKFSNLTEAQIEYLRGRVEIEKDILAMGLSGGARPSPDATVRAWLQSASPLENDPSLRVIDGHAPRARDEAAMMPHTAQRLGIPAQVGQSFTLYREQADGSFQPDTFTLSGILGENLLFEARDANNIVVSEAFVLEHGTLPQVYGEPAPGIDAANLTVWYRPGLDAWETTARLAELAGITGASDARVNEGYMLAALKAPGVQLPTYAVLALFMLVGALVIFNIFNIQLIRRVQQTGLMAVVGASRGQILCCILAEALLYALIALPLGLLLGAGLCAVSVQGVLGMAMPGVEVALSYTPAAFLLAALVTLITVLLSVLRPALRVSATAPVEAVRFSGGAQGRSRRRRYESVDIKRLSRINLWRNPGRTLVTILSLSLCGVLFIGISTVGGSLLGSVEAFARREMAGDMQITFNAFAGEQEETPLTRGMLDQVRALDGVISAQEIDSESFMTRGEPNEDGAFHYDAKIIGYDEPMMQAQLARMGNAAPTIEELRAPGAALRVDFLDGGPSIDDVQLHRLKSDGDSGYRDSPVTLHIVGSLLLEQVVAMGGSLSGYNYIMLSSALEEAAGGAWFTRMVIDVDEARWDAVEGAVKGLVKGIGELHFQSLREAIAQQRNNILGFLMLLYAVIAILALVGFLNLANTTLTGVEQRRAEFGVLRALGLSGADVRRLLWGEGRITAAICSGVSVALGVALGALGFQALRGIGATYMDYSFPLLPCALLVGLMFAVPYWVSLRAGKRMARCSAVELIGSP